MPRITYQTRPEILEAFVGDYAALADAGDQRVVRTGKHVTHLLESGPAGIHDPELRDWGIPVDVYVAYREGFGSHVQARLANPEDVHTMAMVGKMVRNYELSFKDIVDAKITPSGFDNGRRSNAHHYF